MSPIKGTIEVRRNDDGTVDEVEMRDAFGRRLIYLEQMDKGAWFLGLYVPDGLASTATPATAQAETFDIFRAGKKRVRVVQR